MNDQIERFIVQHAQIRHVSQVGFNRETFPLSNFLVALELLGGVVYRGYLRTRCGQNGCLLAASASETEHVFPLNICKPIDGNRLGWSENDLPVS